MAYFELYTTTTGSDTNGGSSATDAADVTKANCSSSGDGLTVTNDAADGWGTAAVGMIICFDTAGTKDFAKITAIPGAADDLTVTPAVALSESSKNVTVGGAQQDPEVTFDMMQGNPTWFADGTPPRQNIEEGTYTLNSGVVATAHGTDKKPFVIQGYKTAAGTEPDTRPVLQYAGKVWDQASFDFFHYQDLHFKSSSTASGGDAFDSSVGTDSYFRRVKFEKTAGAGGGRVVFNSNGKNTVFDECTFENSGTATGAIKALCLPSLHHNCDFIGGEVDDGASDQIQYVSCRFTAGAWVDCNSSMALINCEFEITAGLNGLYIDVSSAQLVFAVNTIFQDAAVGQYAVNADETNFCWFLGHNNCFYNNDENFLNIHNYPGDGDIATDPDLDANGRPQTGSASIGAGSPLYVDIAPAQHQDSASGGVTLVNTRRNAMIGR